MKKPVCLLLILTLILSAILLSAPVTVMGLSGDINEDGEVNNKDVVTLFRIVTAGTTENIPKKYDLNGDGEINNKDVVSLFRQVSGTIPGGGGGGGGIELPDIPLRLNSVAYDEKGTTKAFDYPEFLSKLSSFSCLLIDTMHPPLLARLPLESMPSLFSEQQ